MALELRPVTELVEQAMVESGLSDAVQATPERASQHKALPDAACSETVQEPLEAEGREQSQVVFGRLPCAIEQARRGGGRENAFLTGHTMASPLKRTAMVEKAN